MTFPNEGPQKGYYTLQTPKASGWKCYLFGSKPGIASGMIYCPPEGNVPNFFIRWMMKICLGCTWEKMK